MTFDPIEKDPFKNAKKMLHLNIFHCGIHQTKGMSCTWKIRKDVKKHYRFG